MSDILEAAARALLNAYYPMSQSTAELIAGIILPAVTPLIEAAALEKAACIVDKLGWDHHASPADYSAAIRALKEPP